jgi:hypothetical protein
MMQITPRAEDLLLQLRTERGFGLTDGARFEHDAGTVRLTFAPAAKPRDRILEGARLPIFIAPELADRFLEATIDTQQKDGRTTLIVTRNQRERAKDAGRT